MEALETRLRKRIYVSLYALLFLTILLGVSVLLEGCSAKKNEEGHSPYVVVKR
jgi:hypothetical protein